MPSFKILKSITFLFIASFFLNACNGKLPGADARKYPANPEERVAKNIKEGRGFKIMDTINNSRSGGKFDFGSSANN